VSMAHTCPHSKTITYYPSPVARVLPDWMFDFAIGLVGGDTEEMIGQLLDEVYAAVRGGQYRLATMGIRAVLEQVIIAKVGDHHSFSKNLEQFYAAGYISLMQRDALDNSLEAGHAATHRFFKPTEQVGIIRLTYHAQSLYSMRIQERCSYGENKGRSSQSDLPR